MSNNNQHKYCVLLDTNIYEANLNLEKSDQFKSLKHFLTIKRAKLLMPKIIDLEIRNRISKIVIEERMPRKLEKSRLVQQGFIKIPKEKTIKNKIMRSYGLFVKNFKPEILHHDNLDWGKIIHKAIHKIKPFSIKGAGIQDAIIWQLMIQYLLQDKNHKLFFITENRKDFGVDGNLHEDLQSDLRKHQLKNRLDYFNSLPDFLTQHVNPINFINEAYIRDILDDDIKPLAESLDGIDLEFDASTSTSEAKWSIVKHEFDDYSIDHYYILSEDSSYIELAVELELRFFADIKADKELQEYDYEFTDNDGAMYGSWVDASFLEDEPAWYLDHWTIRINKKDKYDFEVM